MSERSGRDDARRRRRPRPRGADGAPSAPADGPVSLRGTRALERLRDRIERAADELERLRRENAELARRVVELEARPSFDPEGTIVQFDEEPESVRRRVDAFIEAIDQYLATDARRDDAAAE